MILINEFALKIDFSCQTTCAVSSQIEDETLSRKKMEMVVHSNTIRINDEINAANNNNNNNSNSKDKDNNNGNENEKIIIPLLE